MLSDSERRGLLVIALVALVTAWWATVTVVDVRTDAPTVEQVRELNGHLLEEPWSGFALVDVQGRTVSLDSLQGNVIFLNFWASWCPPCREEMPSMMALARSYQDRPFRMVTVTQDDDRAALDAFLAEFGISGDEILVLLDPAGEITRSWGTELLPETYVIDTDGTVVARFPGARDWTSEPAQRLFERLMREPS